MASDDQNKQGFYAGQQYPPETKKVIERINSSDMEWAFRRLPFQRPAFRDKIQEALLDGLVALDKTLGPPDHKRKLAWYVSVLPVVLYEWGGMPGRSAACELISDLYRMMVDKFVTTKQVRAVALRTVLGAGSDFLKNLRHGTHKGGDLPKIPPD